MGTDLSGWFLWEIAVVDKANVTLFVHHVALF